MMVWKNTHITSLLECFLKITKEPIPRVITLRIPNAKCQYKYRIIRILGACSEQTSVVSADEESCVHHHDGFAMTTFLYACTQRHESISKMSIIVNFIPIFVPGFLCTGSARYIDS